MFDDDSSERILPPTERRRREAKERGEIARSPELTAAAILLTSGFVLQYVGAQSANSLANLMRTTVSNAASSLNSTAVDHWTGLLVRGLIEILAPVLLVAFLVGLVSNLIQTGWVWTPALAVPRFRGGSGRWYERGIHAVGRVFLLAMLAWVTWRFLLAREWQLRSLAMGQPTSMLVEPARMVGALCVQLSVCLGGFAMIDYGIRYWRHEQRLKMTIEELKQEQREAGTTRKTKRQVVPQELGPIPKI